MIAQKVNVGIGNTNNKVGSDSPESEMISETSSSNATSAAETESLPNSNATNKTAPASQNNNEESATASSTHLAAAILLKLSGASSPAPLTNHRSDHNTNEQQTTLPITMENPTNTATSNPSQQQALIQSLMASLSSSSGVNSTPATAATILDNLNLSNVSGQAASHPLFMTTLQQAIMLNTIRKQKAGNEVITIDENNNDTTTTGEGIEAKKQRHHHHHHHEEQHKRRHHHRKEAASTKGKSSSSLSSKKASHRGIGSKQAPSTPALTSTGAVQGPSSLSTSPGTDSSSNSSSSSAVGSPISASPSSTCSSSSSPFSSLSDSPEPTSPNCIDEQQSQPALASIRPAIIVVHDDPDPAFIKEPKKNQQQQLNLVNTSSSINTKTPNKLSLNLQPAGTSLTSEPMTESPPSELMKPVIQNIQQSNNNNNLLSVNTNNHNNNNNNNNTNSNNNKNNNSNNNSHSSRPTHQSNKIIHHHLPLSMSVPKLLGYGTPSTTTAALSYYKQNKAPLTAGYLPHQSGNASSGGGSFFGSNPSIGNNNSGPSVGHRSQCLSDEVRQKLKNVILQKLDRNKQASLNSKSNRLQTFKGAVSEQAMMAALAANNPLLNEQRNAQQSQRTTGASFQPFPHKFQIPNQAPAAMIPSANYHNNVTTMGSTINRQQQRPSSTVDENTLTRTISEPNLKVKSALKDRLLEKRKAPFLKIRPGPPPPSLQLQQQQQRQGESCRPQAQNHYPWSNSNNNQHHSSLSLGKLPHPSGTNNMNNESGPSVAMVAAAATLAAMFTKQQHLEGGGSNTGESLQSQQQMAAAVATIAASQSNPNLLGSVLQALQQQQQHQQQQQSSVYQQSLFNNKENKSSSYSFPALPSFNSSQYNQQQNRNNYNATFQFTAYNPATSKFGHMAHVEEENEILLANELKHAAKLNDAVSKSLLYTKEADSSNNDAMDMGHERISDVVVVDEEDELENEERRDQFKTNPALNKSFSSYYESRDGGGGCFNHHQHSDAVAASLQLLRASHSNMEASSSAQSQMIDEAVAAAMMAAAAVSNSNSAASLMDNRQQPLFFSDPNLLRKFQIASISSSSNLNSPTLKQQQVAASSQSSATTTNQMFFNHLSHQQPMAASNTPGYIKPSNNNDASLNTKKCLNRFLKSNIMMRNEQQQQQHLLLSTGGSHSNTTPMEEYSSTNSGERNYRFTTGLVFDELMLKHECTCNNSANHLETPERISSIWHRIRSQRLTDECELVTARVASVSELLACHSDQYVLMFGSDVDTRGKLTKEYLEAYLINVCIAPCRGYALTYDQDNAWNEEFTPLACRLAVGSTYDLARLVLTGKLRNGFAIVRPPGSHAEFNKPLGFCYFNTVAIVAKLLKKNMGLERILIVDWDVHHGNGTQQMTYDDANIMYISVHRHDNSSFFPGTGAIDECGQHPALGRNVNIPFNSKLSPPMGDAEYLAAFRSVVMPIAEAYHPQLVLVSCGFDASDHHPKELGGYRVSPSCFAYMTKKLTSVADGKVVLVLEGGYDIQSLCDCSEMCLNALMNRQIPSFPSHTLEALPSITAVHDLENVVDIQKKYWPCLRDYRPFIQMSHSQYIVNNT